jgi:hypothetical protein
MFDLYDELVECCSRSEDIKTGAKMRFWGPLGLGGAAYNKGVLGERKVIDYPFRKTDVGDHACGCRLSKI